MPSVAANARSIEFCDKTYVPRAWEVSLIYDAISSMLICTSLLFAVHILISNVAGFINTFGNSVGLGRLGWKYYFVFVGWDLVASVLWFLFCVETVSEVLVFSSDVD